MPSYFDLLALIAPIFALIGVGAGARYAGWLKPEADASLMKLVVNVLYPALIFRSVLGNEALADPRNVFWPPVFGFAMMAGGILGAFWVGQKMGLSRGHGLRTFAFSAGIYNYGYIPIPLIESLFGEENIGVLLVHNVGCEVAVWTVGIMVVSGVSLREGWRNLITGPLIALVAAAVGNVAGLDRVMPETVDRVIELAADCAVPMGLIAIGATMSEYLTRPRQLVSGRVTTLACALRLGLIPLVMMATALLLPISQEMRQVMLVQAAMPAGIVPILIARHYGGQPLTAVQVAVGTTVLALITTPLWLRLGLDWLG